LYVHEFGFRALLSPHCRHRLHFLWPSSTVIGPVLTLCWYETPHTIEKGDI
jgi:hypothetical protein